MSPFPQLSSGAQVQYPLTRVQRIRTARTESPDGYEFRLADQNSATVEWEIRYKGLTSDERTWLETHFAEAEGRLRRFTFLDAASNLLRWSENLADAVWDTGPLVGKTGGQPDPLGGTAAWRLVNTAITPQRVAQTIPAPAGFTYAFSLYARSTGPDAIRLIHEGGQTSVAADRPVNEGWQRVSSAAKLGQSGANITFAVEMAPGAAIDVFGFQVDPQPAPSSYRRTTSRSGVFNDARYAEDSLRVVAAANGLFEAHVRLIARGL
ncbi:MAG TPA: hypothetical protein DEH78_13370 [Solibacterales bacterium]|nr:hypothetical protein [Bryobacterales bacterium]